MQYQFPPIVAEIDVIQHNISLYLGICQASIMMGMFPGINIAIFRLHQFPVFFFGMNEGHIAFIPFRFIVHQFEDTASPCKSQYSTVHLLSGLGDRGGKLPD